MRGAGEKVTARARTTTRVMLAIGRARARERENMLERALFELANIEIALFLLVFANPSNKE